MRPTVGDVTQTRGGKIKTAKQVLAENEKSCLTESGMCCQYRMVSCSLSNVVEILK